jgi:tetratricopeptide (TPR) repeat protein
LKAPEEYNAQDSQQSAFRQEEQDLEETLSAPSLSSALAQLGSFVKESPPSAEPSVSSFERLEGNEEPSWLQALKNSSATPAPSVASTRPDTSTEPSASAAYANNLLQTPPEQVEPTTTISRDRKLFETKEPQQTPKNPSIYGNPLLDAEAELEVTMKRPAIRLQPMQHHPSTSQRRSSESHIVSRSQSEERIEKTARATRPTNENLSYRERLVKGYQSQLIGDYDEAMQEYRIIIRSGTDLLNEVVSNVRALLKLAPNYSPGYRVLGDAYMRQGEYLQAMEAYNKALTMTKKVRSRT